MKILQTGDLHLGKIFYETPLIEDQQEMLSQLYGELEKARDSGAPYAALLLAGDIYDRAIPPPEAVSLFDNFLTKTHKAFPALHVFIISGNHDSPRRLSFAAKLLDAANIHIITDAEQITAPTVIENSSAEGGQNEKAAFYCIPFLHGGTVLENIRSQNDLIKEACARIYEHHKKNNPGAAAVVCSHLLVLGGTTSDSERAVIGTAEEVDASLFEDFAYTALGHLHRQQNPKKNVWYSGSPLAYSFSESDGDKFFLSVTVDCAGKDVAVEKIKVRPRHKVVRLKGTFEEFFRGEKYMEFADAYIEVTCSDKTLIENPMARLRARFPYLMSFRQESSPAPAAAISQRKKLLEENRRGSQFHEKIFEEFLRDIHGALPENFEQEKKLFMELSQKIERSEI